jgi:hypothetical protein
MHRVKLVSIFVLLVLLLSIAPAMLAQGPDDSNLPPGIDKEAPQSVERVVVRGGVKDIGLDSMCDVLWWHGYTNISAPYAHHYSESRDEPNHWYPCDIDKIGVRGRLWVDNVLKDEDPMAYSYNSADEQGTTYSSLADCSREVYARSNHYFQEAGEPIWQPETSDVC